MQTIGIITAHKIAPAPSSPTSPSNIKESKYNSGVIIMELLNISKVTKSALEYGKTCLSRLLKTKNEIRLKIILTTETKSKYLDKLFKIFLLVIDLC